MHRQAFERALCRGCRSSMQPNGMQAARLMAGSMLPVFMAAAAQVQAGTLLVDAWTTVLRLASHLEQLQPSRGWLTRPRPGASHAYADQHHRSPTAAES